MGKKRGAPPKSVDVAKASLLQIRLSAAEKEAFANAAKLDGKKISEWIRDRLRRVAREELEEHGESVPFLPGKKPGDRVG